METYRIPAYLQIEHWAARTAAMELAVWRDRLRNWTWTMYDRAARDWAWDANATWSADEGGAAAALACGMRAFEGRARKMEMEVEQLLDAEALCDRLRDEQRRYAAKDRRLSSMLTAAPKRSDAGIPVAVQEDPDDLPLFIAANEPRLF